MTNQVVTVIHTTIATRRAKRAKPLRFRNHYRCRVDGATWSDSWECTCNDRCPVCNAETEPFFSEDKNEKGHLAK